MRKYLLPEGGRAYKANLHSHSTLSDGALTPAEAKRLYKSRGYSVLALTDHGAMIPHGELSDRDFLMLTGYELEFKEEATGRAARQCHLTLIAPEQDAEMPVFHRTKYLFGNSRENIGKANIPKDAPDFIRKYTAECINLAISLAASRGFFISYAHPAWSMEDAADIGAYRSLSAIEIINSNSRLQGFAEENAQLYDALLRRGMRLGALAADDNHNGHPITSRASDSFRAYTVIKAQSLSYQDIFSALKCGNYYASEAPEIRALWAEDGTVHIKCSPAESISFTTATRHAAHVVRTGFDSLSEASFTPNRDDGYVRVTVTDARGKRAYSNAYFLDEIN